MQLCAIEGLSHSSMNAQHDSTKKPATSDSEIKNPPSLSPLWCAVDLHGGRFGDQTWLWEQIAGDRSRTLANDIRLDFALL
jgi:hypothetical protein